MVLALSPLLAQAHVWVMAGDRVQTSEMPCHQQAKQPPQLAGCQYCSDDMGMPLSCDCGDNLLSPSLTIEPNLSITFVLQASPSVFASMLEAPDPPLSPHYRPPRRQLS